MSSPIISGEFKLELYGDINNMFLFKIQKMEYLQQLQQGTLYMKNIDFHKRKGQQNPDSYVGDAEEGLNFHLKNITLTDNTGRSIFLKDSRATVSKFDRNPIFCSMKVIFQPDVTIENEDGHIYFKPPKQIFDDFISSDSKEYGVIIIDKQHFLERCAKKLKDENLSYGFSSIYYVANKQNLILKHCQNDDLLPVFLKNERYSYQNEFRIWVGIDVNDNFSLDIGDLSDISTIISIESARHGIRLSVNIHDFQKVPLRGEV